MGTVCGSTLTTLSGSLVVGRLGEQHCCFMPSGLASQTLSWLFLCAWSLHVFGFPLQFRFTGITKLPVVVGISSRVNPSLVPPATRDKLQGTPTRTGRRKEDGLQSCCTKHSKLQ